MVTLWWSTIIHAVYTAILWCVCLFECVFALHLYANIIRFNRYGSVNSKCVCVCVMYSCPISRWPNFLSASPSHSVVVMDSLCHHIPSSCLHFSGTPLNWMCTRRSSYQGQFNQWLWLWQLELQLKAFTPRMICANVLCVGNIFSYSPTFNVVLHIDCVFSHDKFNAATETFIFSAQAQFFWFFTLNKQIWPIRLHLTTNAK